MGWLQGAIAVGGALLGSAMDNEAADDRADSQRGQNRADRDFIREQAKKAREDIVPLYSSGQEARHSGADAALDVMKRTHPEQYNTLNRGSMNAQKTLKAGLDPSIDAILGNSIDTSGIRPRSATSERGRKLLNNVQIPDMPSIDGLLGGTIGAGAGYDINPGTTTNAQVVEMALANGDINQRDYNWYQKLLSGGDEFSGADSTSWGSVNNLENAMSHIDGLAPENYNRMYRMFSAMYD